MSESRSQSKGYVIIAVVYLLGLFIGALDTGIVTPCRTVIQNDLGMGEQLGVWIITIYTLGYAASIPIMGKLADKHGRKYIYLVSIALFGIGSLLCGLSQDIGSYQVLLAARAIQAFGGGGIMPVATAEFGTAFPIEKRGMALGLVGGVYGIANIFGASAGSLILDVFGQHNWQFVFYLNLPICLFIVIAGLIVLPNTKAEQVKPIDGIGICTLTVMVLSLLYGLKNLDFFDFVASATSTDVYPFLLVFACLIPVFVLVEKRAVDPIINLSYFKDRSIVVTLLLSVVTGIVMMGMIFIPQFAENAMHLKSGSGGYFVVILALFAGVGAPVSGKLIDFAGVKAVLGFGLVASIIGALYLAFVACANPNLFNVVVSLVFIGLGMGFTMGTPLNYMMLQKTDAKESNSALATLSLVRSVGTAVAPAIMVAFIAHAGTMVQDRVMDVLPTQVSTAPLPYAQELTDEFAKLKAQPETQDMMADMDIPDLTSMQTVEVRMDSSDADSSYTISDDMKQRLEESDVTTITENIKALTQEMFAQIKPDIEGDAIRGVGKGIDGMQTARAQLDSDATEMQDAYGQMEEGIVGMDSALAAQQEALAQMQGYLPMLQQVENYSSALDLMPDSAKASMPQTVLDQMANVKTADDLRAKISQVDEAVNGMNASIVGMQTARGKMWTALQMQIAQGATDEDPAVVQLKNQIATLDRQTAQMQASVDSMQTARTMMEAQLPTLEKLQNYASVLDLMPDNAKASMPQTVLDELASVRTSTDLQAKMADLGSAIAQLQSSRSELADAQSQLQEGIHGVDDARSELDITLERMIVLRNAIPATFDEAEQNYLAEIDDRSDQVESVFQRTLDEGFAQMFLLVAACSTVGLVMLMFFRDTARLARDAAKPQEEKTA